MSIAVRASGYIYIKSDPDKHITLEIMQQINSAYRDVDVEKDSRAIIKIDIFGQNGIDYEPLEKILKNFKEFLEDEVVINEWVENNDGGLYFNPEEDED